jgi:hypothetical protein
MSMTPVRWSSLRRTTTGCVGSPWRTPAWCWACCWTGRWHLVAQRQRIVCQLHALLTELVPAGAAKALTSKKAAALLRQVTPGDVVALERKLAARELLEEIRWLDKRIPVAKQRLSQALSAYGTTLTDVHGIGEIGAATILSIVDVPTRFPDRGHFAAFNGTAPLEASSGDKRRHRLSRRGNRQMNKVIHVAARTQIRRDGPGRTYYDRKLAEGKSNMEALRALKRQTLRRHLPPAPRRRAHTPSGPEWTDGRQAEGRLSDHRLCPYVRSHPGPARTLRPYSHLGKPAQVALQGARVRTLTIASLTKRLLMLSKGPRLAHDDAGQGKAANRDRKSRADTVSRRYVTLVDRQIASPVTVMLAIVSLSPRKLGPPESP